MSESRHLVLLEYVGIASYSVLDNRIAYVRSMLGLGLI